ncbi:MAG: TniQ family protein [Mycobacterium sp.]|nr:TniQ family protein [Mycobacterium sp.]
MTWTRTLPIRLEPANGEALDSWLEALAHRTCSGFGDLLVAVGLPTANQQGAGRWVARLTPEQQCSISDATETAADRIRAMTLDWYSGRALHIDPRKATTTRQSAWSQVRGSRFCPECLAETGGRWQLSWRLELTFACTVHRRLLADICPECGKPQRIRPHIGQSVPQPGLCANPATGALGASAPRCLADLREIDTLALSARHPVIGAQNTIDRLIASIPKTFGLYQQWPQRECNVLADIRAIATRALAYGGTADIERRIPQDLFAHYDPTMGTNGFPDQSAQRATRSALTAGVTAATVAAGILIALNTLSSTDIHGAGDRLRWLITTTRNTGKSVSATNVGWCRDTSTVLTGIQLSALGPVLNPSDQLRYRLGSDLPARPTRTSSGTAAFAARLPTMLWPAWSLPLAIPTRTQKELRPALSSAVLLVNSKHTLAQATELLRSPVSGHAVSYVLQGLEADPNWASILTALIRMADYLNRHPPPIDYHRRRYLDYTELLPDHEWSGISRDTATPGGHTARARTARRYLFETLSGMPAASGPFPPEGYGATTKVADFPRYLTTELADELNSYASKFLRDNGIEDEPVQWTPPITTLLKDLRLPGPDPDTLSIQEIQKRTRSGVRLGDIAAEVDTTLDTVRYILQTHPIQTLLAGSTDQTGATPRRAGAFRYAKKVLTEERLRDLYHRRGQSLREVAASVGVSRQTIARLAADYGVPLRKPSRPSGHAYDPEWLYDQYVNQSRPLPAIAEDCGVSTATVTRWAHVAGIPLRGRGGRSHEDALAATRKSAEAPELIRPALQGSGGLQRLQRFAQLSAFATLTEAAAELETSEAVLSAQISRLEREIGSKLLVRAQTGRPMELTEVGRQVITAVRAYDSPTSEDP